jgi:hypothetical protein
MDGIILRKFDKQIGKKLSSFLSIFTGLKGQNFKQKLTNRPWLDMIDHFINPLLGEQKVHHLISFLVE